MADTKISALTAATDLVGSEIAGIQSSTTKRMPIALFDARFLASASFSGLAKITVGTTTPVGPSVGDLWIDTN